MANYFWAAGGGNWAGTGAAGHWYTTSGGPTKWAGIPGPTDNAIFDANSGTGICNLQNIGASCLNLYCNGFGAVGPTTMTITGGPSSSISVYGDVQLSPNQVFDVKQYPLVIMTGTGAGAINTNGNSFGDLQINKTGATVTLNDDLIGTGNATLSLLSGTLNANNKNVTFGTFATSGTTARTLTMGSGTWNLVFESELNSVPLNTWDIISTTNLTFNKDTATIRLNHAANAPVSNQSLVTGLRTALTSGAATVDIVDITGFPTSGYVLIGDEVIKFAGTNTATRQLTTLTRGYGGTTTLASVPIGTAVTGVLLGNSTLTASMTAGVTAAISVVDASIYPVSGNLYIGTEVITYSGTNLTTNQLGTTTVSTPTQNHSFGDPVYSYQAKNFNGGGLTYNTVVFGCFGYKTKNYITGSNTFTSIANSNTGFTWTANSNYYPGFQELVFSSGATNTITPSFTFSGTATYQQYISSSAASATNIITNSRNVGTHSVNLAGSTGLSFTSGSVDYISYYYAAYTSPVYTVIVTGVEAAAVLGNVTIPEIISVTGLYATAVLGSITLNAYWAAVDDTQSTNWVPVNDTQTSSWVDIDDAQTPNWTQMVV